MREMKDFKPGSLAEEDNFFLFDVNGEQQKGGEDKEKGDEEEEDDDGDEEAAVTLEAGEGENLIGTPHNPQKAHPGRSPHQTQSRGS